VDLTRLERDADRLPGDDASMRPAGVRTDSLIVAGQLLLSRGGARAATLSYI